MSTKVALLAALLVAAPSIAQEPPREALESRSAPLHTQRAPQIVHRGTTLGIAEVPRTDPPPSEQDYSDAFELASRAGAGGQVLSWAWRDLEPSPGRFALDELGKQIAFYAGDHARKLAVGIEVLDMTIRVLPDDLLDERFDSPRMLSRFTALLDAVLPLLEERVAYVSIGREVDIYLGYHAEEWIAFQIFYETAVAHVHASAPRLAVGTATTFRGASAAVAPLVAELNGSSDVLILTYDPFGDRFAPASPDAPLSDFPRMAELAGGRPIVLLEVAYSSAAELGSSEEDQAEFVRSIFEAWRGQGERVEFLNIFALHDYTPEICGPLAQRQGEPGDSAYAWYLCSLGLRHADGSPKQAWQSLLEEVGRPAGDASAQSQSLRR
jgi:hypothetical protein